jgi:hypothetical protein
MDADRGLAGGSHLYVLGMFSGRTILEDSGFMVLCSPEKVETWLSCIAARLVELELLNNWEW